jgi:uncharacterized repeat protein (TIGR01451 family)
MATGPLSSGLQSPEASSPRLHLADYEIDELPSNVGVVPGFFKVCKVGPPGYVATFDVIEYEWKAMAQRYDSIQAVVQIQAGKCKLVAQNIPDPWVRVTERLAPGFVLDSIALTYEREVSLAPRGTPGGGFHVDPTNGRHIITDSATVVAAIGVSQTPEEGTQWPQYRAGGATAIFFNSPVAPKLPKLEIAKTALAASVSPGGTIGFQIVVSSTGEAPADAVTLSDELPGGPGVSWSIAPSVAGCAITGTSPQQLSCDFGTLAVGASRTVTVTSATTVASCKKYDNTATVSGTGLAPVSASASVDVPCPKNPALEVSKRAGSATVNAGGDISFVIDVTSTGGVAASDVKLFDILPINWGLDWSITSQPAGNPCRIILAVLYCDYGDLAPGATRSITVQSPTTSKSCKEYDNTVLVKSDNVKHLTASASVTVVCPPPPAKPKLEVFKRAEDSSVKAGEKMQFNMGVTNTGTSAATNVTLSDELPTGYGVSWTIVAQPAGNPCQISNGRLTCNFGTLAAGASRTVSIRSSTTEKSCKRYDNTVWVKADGIDKIAASASITVSPRR